MARAGVGYVAIRGDFGPLYAQLKSQTGPLSSRFGKLGQAVGTAFKVGAAATAGIGVAAIKASADFNQAMTRVVTQAGATSKEVNKLRGQVLKLAKSSEFTPVELANGLFRVESAGIHGAKAMRILNAAQKLASVGGSDLEETTRALTAAMQSGIKGTGRASKTVGTLNAAVGEGSLRMEDLVGALSTGVLPAARQFGLTLTDVTSAIATMTRAGVPAQAAATRLRMTFSLMGAPTDKAAGALESIGLKSTALAEAMRKPHGIVVAVQLLRDHLDGLSKVKQAQVLTQAFGGGRSSSTIATLVQNVGQLGQIYTETGKRAGDFGAAVKKQSEEPAARFKVAMSTIKAELVTIGDKLAPKASKEIEKFAKILGDDRLTNDQKFSKIAERISNAFSKAIPVLANAAAKAAPKAALAFARAFTEANIWGKLVVGGFLLAKMGGLRSFTGVGRQAGVAMGAGMAEQSAAVLGTALPGRLASMGARLRGIGKVAFAALGIGAVAGVASAFTDTRLKKMSDRAAQAVANIPLIGDIGKIFAKDPLQIQSENVARRAREIRRNLRASEPVIEGVGNNFERMTRRSGRSLRTLSGVAQHNMDLIRSTIGENSIGGQRAVDRSFDLISRSIRKSMHSGKISAGEGMRAIEKQARIHSDGSRAEISRNFTRAINAIQRSMDRGGKITEEGTAKIRHVVEANLRLYGLNPATSLKGLKKALKGPKLQNFNDFGKQRGGPIDGGKPTGDSIPAMLERDEYVLNRKAVKKVGRKVLDRINFGAAPRFQKGGLAGMLGAANRLEKAHFPYVWGGGHSASPAPFGPMDCSGAVSYVLQHGGAKIPTMVSGALAAAGQPGPGKVTVFANAGHTFMRLAGRYFGTSASNPGGGAGWFPAPDAGYLSGFAQRHFDASGEMGGIPRVLVDGSASPLKSIVQGAIDQTRSAATSALNSLTSTPIGAGDAGEFSGSWTKVMARIAKQRGWNLPDWRKLVQGESSGIVSNKNPKSTAFGLGQLLDSAYAKYGGGPGSSGSEQISAMAAYIADRYGNPSAAYHSWLSRSPHWYAKGGPVGLTGGGPPPWWRHGLGSSGGQPGGGLAHRLDKTLGTLRKSKKPKVRSKALHALLDRIKGIDIPKGLKGRLSKYSESSNKFGELADRAGQLTVEDKDGNAILGKVNGKTEAEWLNKQLPELKHYRNAIIRGERQIAKVRDRITKLLEQARKRLKQVAVRIRAQSKIRDGFKKSLEKVRKHLEKAREHPKQNRALIKALTGQIHDFEGKIHGINVGLKGQVRVRSGLKKIIGDTGSGGLIGRRSKLNTVSGDLLTNLTEVQGSSPPSPKGILKKLPAVGVLGGTILTQQLRLRDLNAPPAPPDTSGDTDTADSGQADLLRQLLREMTQRAAVSEAQFKVLQGFPPFAGTFHRGGTLPGPVGAERMYLGKAGETVTPAGAPSLVIQNLTIHEDGRASMSYQGREFEVAVERVTRKVTRGGREALPGRGGGMLR